ncbi:MAG: SRPBCC family protein [Acidimicrobiales bacterium]|nr:SRPBCC family protein [Acidimicrobiales bacterium]
MWRSIGAPAETVWGLLTEVESWPEWGPTVAGAELDGDMFELGATGTVATVLGVNLPFEVVEFEEGASWTWKVAGLPATEHLVVPDGDSCRAGFGVPWAAIAYLGVCHLALRRIEDLAVGREESQ